MIFGDGITVTAWIYLVSISNYIVLFDFGNGYQQ